MVMNTSFKFSICAAEASTVMKTSKQKTKTNSSAMKSNIQKPKDKILRVINTKAGNWRIILRKFRK